MIVGGTLCEKFQIRIPHNSRIHIDFSDYSALNLNAAKFFFDNQSIILDCINYFLFFKKKNSRCGKQK